MDALRPETTSSPQNLDALGRLCDDHHVTLFRIANFDLGETAAAQAVAEVLCAVERDPAEFAGPGTLNARLALCAYRYSQRLAGAYATLSPRSAATAMEGTGGLTTVQREVIVLAIAGRIPYRDIADVLDVDPHWVAATLRSGLVALTDRPGPATGQDGLAGVHADEQVELGRQVLEALHRRTVMDQAKGLLMGLHGGDPDRAATLLTQVAQQHNLQAHDLAGALATLAAGRSQTLPSDIQPQAAESARADSTSATG